MKRRAKLPEHYEFFDDEDRPFLVRFDYDEGEEQWFDARAGVGSPGYPASVAVTEVNFGGKWETVETYPQLNIEALEEKVMERITEAEEAAWAEYAERMESA